jgi:hypothetical protein
VRVKFGDGLFVVGFWLLVGGGDAGKFAAWGWKPPGYVVSAGRRLRSPLSAEECSDIWLSVPLDANPREAGHRAIQLH